MAETAKYDENLYSRMLGAYGAETVGKLVQLKVFLSGLRGVILGLLLSTCDLLIMND